LGYIAFNYPNRKVITLVKWESIKEDDEEEEGKKGWKIKRKVQKRRSLELTRARCLFCDEH